MNAGTWLRGLGLMQYQAAFRESGIGIDMQPELTEVQLGHY
jgi:hypothetical protein